MVIRFGMELQEQVYPNWDKYVDASHGERGFLAFLEEHLGLGYLENQEFLRVEQYRQAIQYHLERNPNAFYAESFEADALATADALLSRRDELYLSAWDFELKNPMPTRLRVLAELEQLLRLGLPVSLSEGFAERFMKVRAYILEDRLLPLEAVYLNEPLELLPPHWQALFKLLAERNIRIEASRTPDPIEDGDLGTFQKALLKLPYDRHELNKDGSLMILKSRNESYAATYLTKLFSLNENFRPLCLLSDKNRALDNALIQEGLASFGVVSSSKARPTLQILKLVASFIWNPINPYRLLEFLSLPNIPFNKHLALKLAEAISKKPGLFSPLWYKKKNEFSTEIDARIERASKRKKESLIQEKAQAEKDYKFWFERRRYDIRKQVPIEEVNELFEYVQQWAIKKVDDYKSQIDKIDKKLNKNGLSEEEENQLEARKDELLTLQSPLLTLCEQARRLVQLLETLPEREQWLSHLQLERFVKTINEAVAIPLRPTEAGHAPFVYAPSAVAKTTAQLLWWNFIEPTQKVGFARWYKSETSYLQNTGLSLESIQTSNQRLLWQRMRPVLQARQQLILVVPERVEGRSVNPHPLWGDLHAVFGDALEAAVVNLDAEKNIDFLQKHFTVVQKTPIQGSTVQQPRPFLYLNPNTPLSSREKESFSSLDSLFYYPYQWVFRYLIGLNKSSILSVVKNHTLMGNLSHTVFERLFNEIKASEQHWEKKAIEAWIDEQLPQMFEREAAVLLMYGHEAERVGFVNQLKHAAWSLISSIQNNGWTIKGTEIDLKGQLAGKDISGIADLVLERDGEIAVIDLKWKGKGYRREQIRNMEDLQLVIYSRLITDSTSWAHTAYYIMSDASLIARNQLAFQEAEALAPEDNFETTNQMIWNKMEATYHWRMEQIQSGKIEIRNEATADLIEKEMLDTQELLSLLEMKDENPPFDIYKVLVSMHR